MKEKEEIPSGRAKEAKIEALEMTVEEPTENGFQEQLIEEFCKSQQKNFWQKLVHHKKHLETNLWWSNWTN